MVRAAAARWIGVAAISLLAACSGGGGGGSPAVPSATGVPAATATATLAAPSPAATATPIDTPIPTATAVPTITVPATVPTSVPTDTAPVGATATPTFTPIVPPSLTPTRAPTAPPTVAPTASPTPLTGPIVSAFGIADASGLFNQSVDTDEENRPVFLRQEGNGFIVYVEGRPGASRLPVGTNRFTSRPGDPTRQPDLQIVSGNDLGNGSPAVCDNSFPSVGGVPSVSPPDFSPIQSVSDALNDWSCRFKLYSETDFACTQDNSGNFLFATPSSTVQFCSLVNDTLTFPRGDTILTVRLLDIAGNAGHPVQIVVRVLGGS